MDVEEEELSDIYEAMCNPVLWRKQVSTVTWIEMCFQHLLKRKTMDTLLGEIVIVGSVAEGMTGVSILTQEKSDVDGMFILKNTIAVERHFTLQPHQVDIVKLEHGYCLPGYVLLRNLNGNLDTCSFHSAADYKGINLDSVRHSISNTTGTMFTGSLIHGPANMFVFSARDIFNSPFGYLESMDLVIGIHCHEWPSIAEEWIERCRPFNWPSGDQMAKIIEMGCDLVPVGVPGSDMEDLQWRISFARAERYLIHSLNNAQLKTFWLLKVVFKSKLLGELFHEKISSYIAKTSFLWISEQHNVNDWKEGLCLKYTWLCLRKILSFVKAECCPNYFMRECNLLHKKLNDHEKFLVCDVLENFTREQHFIDNIKNISIISGMKYYSSGFTPLLKRISNSKWVMNLWEQISQRSIEENLWDNMNLSLSTPRNSNWNDAVTELRTFLRTLRKTPSDLHMHNPSLQNSFIRLLSCAQIRLMNVVICHDTLSPVERFSSINALLLSAKLGTETFGVNEIVQIAHVFFTNSFYENTLHIVCPMLQELKVCPCIRMNSTKSHFQVLSSFLLNMANMSFNSPRRPICSLTFFKLEESILTEHLRIEVNSYLLDCEQTDGISSDCFVVVSPLVYAHYIRYKCYRFLERNIESCVALRELETQVLQETVHKYHHLNLLGCSLYESGYFEEAMKTFALSYKERNSRRSVLFHICILLLKCFKNRSNA